MSDTTNTETSKKRQPDERGISVPIVAGSLVALLAFTALAVDLGWFYIMDQRTQRAADAAALAGVIELPGNEPAAQATAKEVATTNGFADELDITGLFPQVVPNVLAGNRLEVEVRTEVPTFFLGVLGFETMEIASTAIAEYVPPLRLGSDDNQFGNSCNQTYEDDNGTGVDCGDDYFANIHGKYTSSVMGDAYSSACLNANGSSSCTPNPTWRDTGYLYGIERGTAASIQVDFLDMAFHNGSLNGDYRRTGDNRCGSGGSCGQTVTANLYAPSPQPLALNPADLICTHTWTPQPQVAESAPYVWENPAGCFTVGSAVNGVYRLQIVVENPSNDGHLGLNRYSLRVNTGAKLYGLRDMSIYNNTEGGTSTFKLAEVLPYYAGKTFVIEMYDAGESSQNGTIRLIDPRTGSVYADGCRIFKRDHTASTWTPNGTPTNCEELVTPGEYNGDWLKFEVDLPDTYTCTDCFFAIEYDYTAAANDTTTWRAYVLGNPIRLVNN